MRKAFFIALAYLRLCIFLILSLGSSFSLELFGQVTVTGSNGADGTRATLGATFAAINAQPNQAGRIITITITANITESATAVLNQPTTATWTSLTIVPSGGVNRVISGSVNGSIIEFNGADNVIIDGLGTGGNSFTIRNTHGGGSPFVRTIRFINDATFNIIRHCTIEASFRNTNSAPIVFATGTITGNDHNQIVNNIIRPIAGFQLDHAIFSTGSSTTVDNSNITISGNQIIDIFDVGLDSRGIYVLANNSAWTISGNRFFQTYTRTFTAAVTHRAIQIISGDNHLIENNIIGFADAAGTGITNLAGTSAHSFIPIEVNVGSTLPTIIRGNTIAGISFSTGSGTTTLPGFFSGISVLDGRVEIGNNTIGSISSATSITIVSTTSLGVFTGIYVSPSAPATIQNNRIGGIVTGGAATVGYTFHGIHIGGTGNHIVRSNTLGSATIANSIRIGTSGITTTGVCTFNAINSMASTGITIDQNLLQNVSVFGTGASVFNGILNAVTTGIVNLSNNQIIGVNNTGTGASAGISITSGTSQLNIIGNNIHSIQANTITTTSLDGIRVSVGTDNNIMGNTIHSLQTNALTSGTLNGIAITGGTTFDVMQNKIYNLSSSSAGITGTGAINGILVTGTGAGLNSIIANNLIGDLRATAASGTNLIRGVALTNTGTTSSINFYHNTIFLSAPTTSGANLGTSGVFHTASTTATTSRLDMRNNIIVNISEFKGTGTTVAFRRSAGTAGMLANYAATSNNNLFLAGTPEPGRLIYADGTSSAQTVETLIIGVFTAGTITPRDQQSITELPTFLSILGASPDFLKINPATLTLIESGGTVVAGITVDFDGEIRAGNPGFPPQLNGFGLHPDIGADEFDGTRPVLATITGIRGWRMIASPTLSTYLDWLGNFVTQGFTGATAPTRQPNLLWFDETDPLTTNMSWRTLTNINSSVPPGRGHYFYVFGNIPPDPLYTDVLPRNMVSRGLQGYVSGTFSYSGTNHPVTFTPNQTNQTGPGRFYDINLADEGWNLLGNPSARSLNWDAMGWTKTNMDNVIYVWDPHISQWRTWNGITGNLGNGLIAPFQAFWVRANAANPVLSFNQNVLTVGGFFFGGAVKEAEVNEDITIRIGGSFNEVNSEIFISFTHDGRVGPDRLDAYRLEPLSESFLAMFTISSSSHQMPLVINSLPIVAPDVIRLPVYLGGQTNQNPINGPVSLTWEIPQNWPSQWSITLHNHQNQTVVDMNATNSYVVAVSGLRSTSIANSDDNSNIMLPNALIHPVSSSSMLKSGKTPPPLSIIINKKASATDLDYVALTPKLFPAFPNPFAYYTYIHFSLPEQMPARIDVFDIQGRLIETVANETFAAGHNTIRWSPQQNTSNTIFIIRLYSSNTIETTKVVRFN